MRRILREIAASGTPDAALRDLPSFADFLDFIGLPEITEVAGKAQSAGRRRRMTAGGSNLRGMAAQVTGSGARSGG